MGMSLAMGLSLSSLRNGAAWSPARLLTGASQLAYYDPSDLSTLFQDSAGTTPVTTDGQSVGLVLDKSQGLVLGPELVTNGTFDSNLIGWTTTAPATATWSSGEVNLARNSGSSVQNLYQLLSLTAGKSYRISITVSAVSNSVSLFATGGGVQIGTSITAAGTYTFTYLWGASDTGIFVGCGGSTTATATIDNISVRELPGNHLIQSTAGSRPLYGFHPATGVRNLLTKTEEFDNVAWVKSAATVTPNAGVSPDGAMTADLVSLGSGGIIRADVANVATGAASLYVKQADSGSAAAIRISTNNTTAWGTGYGQKIALTSEWQRIDATGTLSSGSTTRVVFGTARETDGTSDPDCVGNVLIWGAQLETGSTATAYQKVNTANGVTEAGVPTVHFLKFDGTDDFLVSAANVNPGSVDKVQVFAGVRKVSDAAFGIIAETSAVRDINDGALNIFGRNVPGFGAGSRGTTNASANGEWTASPVIAVLSGLYDISGDVVQLRVDGTQVAQSAADQGTGNFLTYPLYVGRRGGTALPFNGNIYSLIVRFSAANLDAAVIYQAERWTAGKCGVTL